MNDLLIMNVRCHTFTEDQSEHSVWIQNGQIASYDPLPQQHSSNIPRVDGGGRLLTAGLIDLHIHGIEQWLFESGPDVLIQGVNALASQGVTTVLPTLYRVMSEDQLSMLSMLADALDDCMDVNVPGFHLEGPFLKLAGAGAQTRVGDVAYLDRLIDAAKGRISAMSISPDAPEILPVIRHLVKHGIVVFMTHTQADVDQTLAAIDAGARHATHFYDVFPAPEITEAGARPVGCVETILADPKVSVDFIADGVHVHPMAIKMALAAKGDSGVILITDANIGAGLGEGVYDTPWGFAVRVREGDAARIQMPGDPRHGSLAGSALTMPRGIANLRRWLEVPEDQVWAMGTRNPAHRMGWLNKGVLTVGSDADLVIWDDDDQGLRPWKTFVGGRCVFNVGGQ